MIEPFAEPLPQSVTAWEARKAEIRATLRRLVGDLPPLFLPEATVLESLPREGHVEHRIAFDNGAGATVIGLLLVPEGRTEPGPAILYSHCHGLEYEVGKEELLGASAWGPQ